MESEQLSTILTVDPFQPASREIGRAARALKDGRLVAFPTETVYGLGASALDPAAVRRIFEAKERPGTNPLIVHVPDAEAARALVSDWPEAAERAAGAFWPGPLTLVLPKREHVPDTVTAGLGTVGVRVPSHPVALALLREAGVPVAAPSANPFTRLSPTTAGHVAAGLGERVDLILDGGATPIGIESTVLDLSGPRPVLLRPGIIGLEELTAVLGPVEAGPEPREGSGPRPSPGMLERHYAPAAELRLYHDSGEARRLAAGALERGATVGALPRHPLSFRVERTIPMPDDPAGYARLLYASLHSLDDADCDLVLAEMVPEGAAWDGVRDRLLRAARRG